MELKKKDGRPYWWRDARQICPSNDFYFPSPSNSSSSSFFLSLEGPVE